MKISKHRACPQSASVSLLEPLESRLLLTAADPAIELFGVQPAVFVENQGQWADPAIRYAYQGSAGNVLHTDSGPVFQVFRSEQDESGEIITRQAVVSVSFEGAQAALPIGVDQVATAFNYNVGDQADWRSNVPGFQEVAYSGLWDGIDLLTSGNGQGLKYEFHVAPGADPAQIQLSYAEIDGLALDEAGNLHVQTAIGELVDQAPTLYQVIGDTRVEVAGSYQLVDADTVGFSITGAYDPAAELVIDPAIVWRTFVGGSDGDQCWSVATGSGGDVFVTGRTYSPDLASGGYDPTFDGGDYGDIFVVHVSASAQHLWSTYLGGSGNEWYADVAVDSANNVFVGGRTMSAGWVSGGFDTAYGGGWEGFLVKLTGSGQHVWSTYLGSSTPTIYEEHVSGVAVGPSGDAFVAGCTEKSEWFGDGSADSTGYIARVAGNGSLVWAKGLPGQIVPVGIAVDAAENVFVVGETSPWVAPWGISGGFDVTYGGNQDAFVLSLDSSGNHRWSSYLGGSDQDVGRSIAIGPSGDVFVEGTTSSAGWVAGGYDLTHGGGSDVFVARISNAGNQLLWSTYLGGSADDYIGGRMIDGGGGLATDAWGNVIAVGVSYPSTPPWVAGGWDSTPSQYGDAFVVKMGADGAHIWSSYVGDGGAAYDAAVDGAGNIFVAGGVGGATGWIVGDVYDTTFVGGSEGFLAKIGADNRPPVAADDFFVTRQGGSLTWAGPGLLANDTDADGDVLTASLVNGPSHGILTVNGDGSFSYVPESGFSGADSFAYKAHDGQADSNEASVTMWVNAVATTAGQPWAWGGNSTGQLGDGTTGTRLTAVPVSALDGITQLDGGTVVEWVNRYHSVSLREDGTVWSWGDNAYGQLGDGTTTGRLTAVQTVGLTGVVEVSAYGFHSMALKSDGTVWAWGVNSKGELGDGTTTNRSSPEQVVGLTGVVAIAASDGSSYALRADGTVWAWGFNSIGQLGDGTTTDRWTPGLVSGLTNVVAIEGSSGNGMALRSDGTVWNWGQNDSGRLGDGTRTNRLTPVQVVGLGGVGYLTDVTAIAVGRYTEMALRSDGTVWSWGANDYGMMGIGSAYTYQLTPVQAVGLTGVTAIAGGQRHALALKSDGSLWGWGANYSGQLGDGTTTNRYLPVRVPLPYSAVSIGAGMVSSMAVLTVGDAAPVAAEDAYTASEDALLTVQSPGVLANDSDAGGDALTAILVEGPTHGALVLSADGSFTYAPDLNFNGSDSFTYRASDGQADSNVATVSITVNSVNDAPVAVDDAATTDEDTPVSGNVLGNDFDVDGGAAQGHVFTDDFGDGVSPPYWNIAQSNSGFYAFDGSQGDVRFAKVGSNPVGIQAIWAELKLDAFSPTNRLSGDFDVQVDFRDAVLPGVGADQVEFQAKFADGYYFFVVRQHGDGRNDVHVWEGVGGNRAIGQINTTDAAGTLRITRVGNVMTAYFNEAVVWSNPNATTSDLTYLHCQLQNNLSSNGNTAVTFDNFRIENAAVEGNGPELAAALETDPTHGTVALNSDGSFTYTPAANFNGTDSFTYLASAGQAIGNVATVTITVSPVNDAPVVAQPVADVMAREGSSDTIIDLSGTFVDPDAANGDQLSLSLSGNSFPELVGATLDGTQLTLSYLPGARGTATLAVRAADLAGATAEDTFVVRVVWGGPIWYVDDLTDPLEDGSPEHPFDAIQEAINVAGNGEEVLVLPGLYAGTGNRDISFKGKPITVRSQAGAAETTIDSQGAASAPHRGFIFQNGETTASVLQGFTIRGGYASAGGGIAFTAGGGQVLDSIITGNYSTTSGGGISITTSSFVRVSNTELSENRAMKAGGGLSTNRASVQFEDNVVVDNVAESGGGGGAFFSNSAASIWRSRFVGNQAPGTTSANNGGGGLGIWAGTVSVLDSVFLANYSGSDGGAMDTMGGDGVIQGNLFVRNRAAVNGGAVCLHETAQDFIGNTVLDNAADRQAGGVRIHGQTGVFSQNVLAGNISWRAGVGVQGGGGVVITAFAPTTITNSLFVGNYAVSSGGGVSVASGVPPSLLQFCTIAENTANGGNAMYLGAGASLQVSDSILWGSASPIGGAQPDVQYSDVQGGYAGAGNINANPLFLGGPSGAWTAAGTYDPATVQTVLTGGTWMPGELVGKFINPDTADAKGRQFYIVANDADTITVWGDASALVHGGDGFQIYDYRLQAGSPAIDAGTDVGVNEDLGNAPRPLDFPGVDNNGPLPEFDMGAYEADPAGFLLAVDNAYLISEDGLLAVGAGSGVAANDIPSVGVTVSLVSDVAHGSLTLEENGAFTYDPDPDFNGLDAFIYKITSGGMTSAPATATILVQPVNDSPVTGTTELETLEDTAVEVDLRGLVTDVETPPEQLVFAVGGAINGTVELLADGHTARFAPDLNYSGLAYFEYSVGDTGDNGDPPITVRGVLIDVLADAVADVPLLAVQDAEGDEDSAIPLSIVADLMDKDGSEILSITIAGVPDGASLSAGTDNHDGTWTVAPEELPGLTITPPHDSDADFVLTVTATARETENSDAASTSADLPVTVNNLVDLSGRVFDDRDNDGLFEPGDGDAGIAGVMVELWQDQADPAADVLIGTIATGAQGQYRFDANLSAGTYKVVAAQASRYLDGKETAGNIGGNFDNSHDSDAITDIVVGEPGTTADGSGYDFAELRPASLQGLVWEDFNDDGEVNLGELAIRGVPVRLTGTDDRGAAVDLLQDTNAQGLFEFVGLRPGKYAVEETQPAGFIDGKDVLGEVTEPAPGIGLADPGLVGPPNDQFTDIDLVAGTTAVNYNFGERIDGGQVHAGQTATIGFWQNKNGQNLIKSLNGDASSTRLGNWLAATFPNMYGDLTGKTNAQVADLYKQLFKRNAKDSPGGPPKLDAQVLAVALATYVTKDSLAGISYATGQYDAARAAAVERYGFDVTAGGVGSCFFNIGDNAEAFDGYLDYDSVQVIDLLLATDRMSFGGLLYDDADGDGAGDGQIDAFESLLRTLANEVYTAINEAGNM